MTTHTITADALLNYLLHEKRIAAGTTRDCDLAHLINAYRNWCRATGRDINLRYHLHNGMSGLAPTSHASDVNRSIKVRDVDYIAVPAKQCILFQDFIEEDEDEELDEDDANEYDAKEDADMPPRNNQMIEAAKLGAKLAIANEAGDVALDLVKKIFPNLDLKDADQRALGKVLAAFTLSYAAELSGQDNTDKIHAVCQLVITSATQELTASKLKTLKPTLTKLTKLADKLPEAK